MPHKISDKELIEELEKRFNENEEALEEQKKLMVELELVNEKLVESEKLKSQFLSNIRNEINNPLSSILGLSENMLAEEIDESQIKLNAKLICSEAHNLDFQFRNVFIAAEIEAGLTSPEIVNIEVLPFVRSIIKSFQYLTQKKQIKINLITNLDDETTFKTDSEKLQLILTNVLANGIEFSNPENEVNITISILEDNQLIISVQDFGIGINQKDQAIIYDRFKQLESGSTKSHGGHGLGLSITKALLEIIDGEIFLDSELNKGSTFTVKINEGFSAEGVTDMSSDGNEFFFSDDDEMIF